MSLKTTVTTEFRPEVLSIENGKCQTVAYIDFAKAFDSVCHRKLTQKLKMYGISGSLLQWIGSF